MQRKSLIRLLNSLELNKHNIYKHNISPISIILRELNQGVEFELKMTTIKKQDFIQLEYTGKLKQDDVIFDTTNEETAKSEGIHNPSMPYGQYIVCLGRRPNTRRPRGTIRG